MYPAWIKVAVLLSVAVALTVAPCRNCVPEQRSAQPMQAGHDCCPKPKPVEPCHEKKTPQCAWQPTDASGMPEKVQLASLDLCAGWIHLAQSGLTNVSPLGTPRFQELDPSPPGNPASFILNRSLRR